MLFTLEDGHRQNGFYSMFASCTLKVKPNLTFALDLSDTCRIINVKTSSNDWQTTAWMYSTLDNEHRPNLFYSMFALCTLKVQPNLTFAFDLSETCRIIKIGTNAND